MAHTHYFFLRSNSRRIQHNPNSSSNSLCRKIMSELGTNCTSAAVRTGHLSPDHSDLARFLVSLGNRCFGNPVHVGHTFPQVEFSVFLRLDTFDSQQGSTFVLVAETALVTKEYSFAV